MSDVGGQPDQVKICVACLEVRPGTAFVSGEIWFTLGETDFPGAHWTDSPLSVLGSLGEAIRSAAAGESAVAYFFDGTFDVGLIPDPAGHRGYVEVLGINTREGLLTGSGEGVVEACSTVPLDDLRRQYLTLVAKLEAWAQCHDHAEVAEILAEMVRTGGTDVS